MSFTLLRHWKDALPEMFSGEDDIYPSMKQILTFITMLSVGLFFFPRAVLAASIVDSYSETNITAGDYSTPSGGSSGQSFTANISATLTSVQFALAKNGSPTGNVVAKIYSHTGTYGSTSQRNTLLATSDTFDTSTIGTSYPTFTLTTFTFSGAQQISLVSGTYYTVDLDGTGHNCCDFRLGIDSTAQTHSGNPHDVNNTAYTSLDHVFYVYGDAVAAASAPPAPPALMWFF